MSASQKERMLAGALYDANDPELRAERAEAARWMVRYNASLVESAEACHALLTVRFASVGISAVIRPPFHCDYGGNIHLGAGAFLNFNCVILDVARVDIGDGAQIGPGVQIYAADHPRDAITRKTGLELGQPVRIGRNVWIGGGATILPGVTVGDDAIVGAGSVVTRDVATGATVVGNPARATSRRQPAPGGA